MTDKTRKILWGRSGNRCAVCEHELVVDATAVDDESVVGDECHIVSGKGQGPRYDSAFPSDRLDEKELGSKRTGVGSCLVHCRCLRSRVRQFVATGVHEPSPIASR
jgi:hypothetical protein